jgi:hypothetical protein
MAKVTLAASPQGEVVLACRDTTISIPTKLAERISLYLDKFASTAQAAKFDIAQFEHFYLIASPGYVALADHNSKKIIFITAKGARTLKEQMPHFCNLARVLPAHVNQPRSYIN